MVYNEDFMPYIILCCGKPCSGKTTFSKFMEQKYSYVHFSADEWMLHFYKETNDHNIFNSNLEKCKEMIYRISEKLLLINQNIILDFGFWKRKDREELYNRFNKQNNNVQIVYFPINENVQLQYMNKRQNIDKNNHFMFNKNILKILNSKFEEPDSDEKFLLINEYVSKNRIEYSI